MRFWHKTIQDTFSGILNQFLLFLQQCICVCVCSIVFQDQKSKLCRVFYYWYILFINLPCMSMESFVCLHILFKESILIMKNFGYEILAQNYSGYFFRYPESIFAVFRAMYLFVCVLQCLEIKCQSQAVFFITGILYSLIYRACQQNHLFV